MSPTSINLIALTSYYMYQPHLPHTHGTLPPDRLQTRVAMMSVDQTNKVCRSIVSRDLSGVQSMSMVTTQPIGNCERAIKYQLTSRCFA